MIQIPLTSQSEQKFTIEIQETLYNMRVLFNTRNSVWYISIADEQNKSILNEVALLGGVNILEQYNVKLKNMFSITLENPKLDPTGTNLGVENFLYIVEEDD